MKNYNLKAIKQQAGMTLIELTVVLLVLVGLAGLTIPYISGFVGKTHNATSADSGASLFNSLQLYAVSNNGLPNGLNLLTDKLVATAPISYLDNSFNNTTANTGAAGVGYGVTATNSTTNFALLDPTTAPKAGTLAKAITSLQNAGVTKLATLPAGTVAVNADGTFTAGGGILNNGATFTPEIAPASITATTTLVTDTVNGLAGGTPVVGANGLTANGSIAGALGYTPATGHQLIVLGVGQANAAIGKTLSSVPVHFGDKGSLQPTYTYSRFLAAVDVDTAGVTGTVQAAKMVGIVHAPDTTDGWESLYSSISAYYQS